MQPSQAAWRYPGLLLAAFTAIVVLLGVSPTYRQDWVLENLLVFAALAILIATRHRLRFSNTAYTLLFAFLVLHEIGAHYTYSLVPYDTWLDRAMGATLSERLGLQRNHYDRLIHFAYGMLVLLPVIELLRSVAPPRGVWRYLLPVLFILSNSAIYELIEWAAAVVFGGELGTAYLGTQGDEWDSQKDMLFASAGAAVATLFMARTPASLGLIAWSLFFVAAAFTTALFVLLDPAELPPATPWWTGRPVALTVTFFSLWFLAAASAVLAMRASRRSSAEPAL
jgi:putative membrane protein